MVHRKDVEILDQEHQMFAEGAQDEEPKASEISTLLLSEGFNCWSIEIWFDHSQRFWRWYCDIEKVKIER